MLNKCFLIGTFSFTLNLKTAHLQCQFHLSSEKKFKNIDYTQIGPKLFVSIGSDSQLKFSNIFRPVRDL